MRRRLAAFALLVAACKERPPADRPTAPAEEAPAPGAPLTYWSRVEPILSAHCVSCHAEGGIGPMPLTSFADAKTHAGAIAYQARTRQMPPWLPDTSTPAELRHSRALGEEEIRTLERWAELGAPEGERGEHRQAPVKRTFAALAGRPDRDALADEGYAPKRGRPDDVHCFVLDPKLERTGRVVGASSSPASTHLLRSARWRASSSRCPIATST